MQDLQAQLLFSPITYNSRFHFDTFTIITDPAIINT